MSAEQWYRTVRGLLCRLQLVGKAPASLYVSAEAYGEIEDFHKANADNLAFDLQKRDGLLHFRGIPVRLEETLHDQS